MNKLIELYCAICHHSEDSRIAEKMQHGSNNKSAQFTDVELMTAYLWGAQQGLLTRKSIYNFIRTYHLGEFQKLPSYQAFCRRLNRLAELGLQMGSPFCVDIGTICIEPAVCDGWQKPLPRWPRFCLSKSLPAASRRTGMCWIPARSWCLSVPGQILRKRREISAI